MVDSRNLARVTFTGTPATAIAEGRTAEATLARLLDAGRSALAAELLGIAGEAFARTLDYLRQRRQFGRPIGSFQALQHRAAQAHCTIELARSLVRAAARALDDDAEDAGLLVAAAKAKAGDAAILATDEAVQMHGGIDIGLFLKRARVAAMLLGDGDFLAERVAHLRGL
jgi:alkylation response protein AidB-like acyl-CoA dehydrogenase